VTGALEHCGMVRHVSVLTQKEALCCRPWTTDRNITEKIKKQNSFYSIINVAYKLKLLRNFSNSAVTPNAY
jgi:hypothetical protein